MKKNLMFLVCFVTSALNAAEPQKQEPPLIPYPGLDVYASGNGKLKLLDVEQKVVDGKVTDVYENFLLRCKLLGVLNFSNLASFKEVETSFQERGYDIFKTVVSGSSILRYAMSLHPEVCGMPNTKEKSDAFIDYLLSRMQAEDLNRRIPTSYAIFRNGKRGVYHPTAVGYAASYSPDCLRKILAHPHFDPTLFLHPETIRATSEEGAIVVLTSDTPQTCVAMHREWLAQSRGETDTPTHRDKRELIAILTEKFKLSPYKWEANV